MVNSGRKPADNEFLGWVKFIIILKSKPEFHVYVQDLKFWMISTAELPLDYLDYIGDSLVIDMILRIKSTCNRALQQISILKRID